MSTAYGTLLAHASPKMVDLATLLLVVKNRPFCSSDSEPLISSIAMPYFIRHHKIGKPPDSKYGCRCYWLGLARQTPPDLAKPATR